MRWAPQLAQRVLSDRARPYMVGLLVLWIGAMGWYYAKVTTARSAWVADCTQNPQACEQRRIFLALVEVEEDTGLLVRVRKSTRIYEISGMDGEFSPGEVISLIASVPELPGDPFVVESYERHPLRKWKVRLSVLGLLASAAMVLGSFRIQDGAVVERG